MEGQSSLQLVKTMSKYSRSDFQHSPLIAFYEVTRACDLVCQHCRACAQRTPAPDELTPELSKRLIDQLTCFEKPPTLVLTGGDPLKREDIFELIEYARAVGLDVAITPSATPLMTSTAIERLHHAGISRMAISIDGATAANHDAMRGVTGSFDCALQILADARTLGIPLQVNTTLTPNNLGEIDAMANLMARANIVLWSVFFIVPVGRADAANRLTPEQYEQAFARLWYHAQQQTYAIKTTEAPHYRRFVAQQKQRDRRAMNPGNGHGRGQRALLGVNDGKGIMFISHTGVIHPSGFLPITCGTFPWNHVVDVYQHSPVFRRLRDPESLQGKCGTCEFRHICGGSRARAYALTGDFCAEEPDCIYIPPAMMLSGTQSTSGSDGVGQTEKRLDPQPGFSVYSRSES